MNFMTLATFYLLAFRLAIVAVGAFCIGLGYRLLVRGVVTSANDSGSTIESSVAGARITVRNAAPGTAFAVFGAFVISVMLVQSSPSVTLETLNKYRENAPIGDINSENSSETSAKLVFRGDHQNTIASMTKQGIDLESRKDLAGAERAYQEAVATMAEPMNDLAWLYLNTNRSKEALGLASLACQLRPNEPRYVDTLKRTRLAVQQQ